MRASLRAFFRLRRMDLDRSQIEFVEVVLRILAYGDRELLFLFGKISFGAREPAGDHVKSGQVLRAWSNPFQSFPSQIDLPETKSRGGKIELAVDAVRLQTRDLRAPRNGFLRILFFSGLSKNFKGVQR